MIITGRQIRGARGLLGWTIEDLAVKSDVNRITIRQVESDTVQPQEKTLTRIFSVLDRHGVEFLEEEGVKIRKQQSRAYSGKAGFRQLLDHIYETVKDGARIRQFNFGDMQYLSYAGEFVAEHIKRMAAIEDLDAKVLETEGENELPVTYCQYRTLDKAFKDMPPWYLYNDYLVFALFEKDEKKEFITIHSKLLAERYTKGFDIFWKTAESPKKKRK